MLNWQANWLSRYTVARRIGIASALMPFRPTLRVLDAVAAVCSRSCRTKSSSIRVSKFVTQAVTWDPPTELPTRKPLVPGENHNVLQESKLGQTLTLSLPFWNGSS